MLVTAAMRSLLVLLLLAGCVADDPVGEDGQLSPLPPPGKEDGQYHNGLRVDTDSSRTDVWKVTHQWEDKSPEAGVAWPANSGLTWDQKYSAWIQSFEWTPGVDGW